MRLLLPLPESEGYETQCLELCGSTGKQASRVRCALIWTLSTCAHQRLALGGSLSKEGSSLQNGPSSSAWSLGHRRAPPRSCVLQRRVWSRNGLPCVFYDLASLACGCPCEQGDRFCFCCDASYLAESILDENERLNDCTHTSGILTIDVFQDGPGQAGPVVIMPFRAHRLMELTSARKERACCNCHSLHARASRRSQLRKDRCQRFA